MSRPASRAVDQARNPVRLEDAAGVGDADHERACAARMGFARRERGRSGETVRLRAGELADAEVARPVAKTERRLRVTWLRDVAQEQQVRRRQADHERGRPAFPGTQRTDCRHRVTDSGCRQNLVPTTSQCSVAGSCRVPTAPFGEEARRGDAVDSLLIGQVPAVEFEIPSPIVESGAKVEWSCSSWRTANAAIGVRSAKSAVRSPVYPIWPADVGGRIAEHGPLVFNAEPETPVRHVGQGIAVSAADERDRCPPEIGIRVGAIERTGPAAPPDGLSP